MLDSLELREQFSEYEKSHILAPPCQSHRAEKLLDAMGLVPADVFELFLTVLRRMKPCLAVTLEDTWKEEKRVSSTGSSLTHSSWEENEPSRECVYW